MIRHNPVLWLTRGGLALAMLLLVPLLLHAVFIVLPGVQSYVVVTASMAPAIDPGSIVYVASTGSYQVGDVITFVSDDSVVTHRIVETTAEGFRTQGDANEVPDGTIVPPRRVIGEVVATVPWYGHVVAFASTAWGRVLFVGIPSLLLVLGEVHRLLGSPDEGA